MTAISLNHGGIKPVLNISAPVAPKAAWNDRLIARLDGVDQKLEKVMPNFTIQNKFDDFTVEVQKKFEPLKKFNDWIDSNGKGAWNHQLGTFLAKLPLRAARNILNLVFQIIKALVYATVHPLKALNNCAKLLIKLAHELTKPETWSKMGIGMMGASLGQALVTGNPISVIGVGIGAAMLIWGLSAGAIKAAVQAKSDQKFNAVKEALIAQAKQLPEAALTGFCMGLIMGAVQKHVQAQKIDITTQEQVDAFANHYVQNNNLPAYDQAVLSKDFVDIQWSNLNAQQYVQVESTVYNHIFAKTLPSDLIGFHTEYSATFDLASNSHVFESGALSLGLDSMVPVGENIALSTAGGTVGVASATA